MPPGISVTEVWNTRITSTMATFLKKKPVDQVFSGNLILGMLLGEQSRANKKSFPLRANRVLRRGGRKCRIPIRYQASTNTTSFSHADELPLNVDDIHTMVEAKWAYYTDAVVVTWQEDIENQGEAKVFSIVEERTVNALDSIKDQVDSHLLSTGDGVSVGNSGKNIIGLQHLLSTTPTSGTVWGLDRNIYTFWRNQLITAGGTFASTGLAKLANTWVTVSGTNGEDPPTLFLTTPAQFEAYHALVAAVQQITITDVGDRGFQSLQYMGRPIFYDSGVPDHTWYSINMNYMNAMLQSDAQFKVIPFGMGSGKQMLKGIWRIVFGAQIGFERYDRQGVTVYTG